MAEDYTIRSLLLDAMPPPTEGDVQPNPGSMLVVDNRRLERDTLSAALERAMPGTRVDVVQDIDGAVEYLQRRSRVDVVLIDASLLLEGWVAPLRTIGRFARRARLVILSAPFDVTMETGLREVGVHGAFSSRIGIYDLVERLHRIARGEIIFELYRAEDRRVWLRRHFGLTEREFQIMELLADGARNGQIAGWLDISESTVRVHVSKVLRKLGADTRLQAYDKWRRAQMLPRLGQDT